MAVDWKQQAYDQLDFHWRQFARPRLDGLTDAEYFWEPADPSGSLRRRGAERSALAAGRGDLVMDFEFPDRSPAPVTTIAWRLGHVAVGCFGHRAITHFPEVAHAPALGEDGYGTDLLST